MEYRLAMVASSVLTLSVFLSADCPRAGFRDHATDARMTVGPAALVERRNRLRNAQLRFTAYRQPVGY